MRLRARQEGSQRSGSGPLGCDRLVEAACATADGVMPLHVSSSDAFSSRCSVKTQSYMYCVSRSRNLEHVVTSTEYCAERRIESWRRTQPRENCSREGRGRPERWDDGVGSLGRGRAERRRYLLGDEPMTTKVRVPALAELDRARWDGQVHLVGAFSKEFASRLSPSLPHWTEPAYLPSCAAASPQGPFPLQNSTIRCAVTRPGFISECACILHADVTLGCFNCVLACHACAHTRHSRRPGGASCVVANVGRYRNILATSALMAPARCHHPSLIFVTRIDHERRRTKKRPERISRPDGPG